MKRCSPWLQRFCFLVPSLFRSWFLLAFLGLSGTPTTQVLANEPAAMVEEITSGPDSLSAYDYLYPGRVISLGENGALTLIYFKTCLRERILGGKVTVQEHKSIVQGSSQLSRNAAGCGLIDRQFYNDDRRTSAAMVFRRLTSIPVIDHLSPRFETLNKSDWISIIELPSALEVFRTQQPDQIIDLNSLGFLLKPGSVYRVETNDHFAIIQIEFDSTKKTGSSPILIKNKKSYENLSGYQ